jgi:ABC-type transport system involved in multi-copper enzyme maturation permease subunit
MLDAYRELNAKKLFWISMVISALVVIAFAAVSLTPKGIKVLAWEFPSPLNLALLSNATFYKFMFQSFGVKFWLTWAATILGLVATCAMIPDFTAGGAVELALSKPIRRARLFLTKYLAGLLFMFLQVSVFSVAAVLVIGIRGHEWVPSLLLAIPIVTLTYSYLFSVCALVGLVTRSTIFALIATLVVWVGIFAVHTVESAVMLQLRVAAEMNVERTQQRLEKIDSGEKPEAQPKPKSLGDLVGGLVNAVKPGPPPATRESLEAKLAEYKDSLETWTRWHRILYAVKTVLPKTTETTDLLQRVMFAKGELQAFEDNQVDRAEKMRSDRMRMRGREQPSDRPVEMGDPLLAREVDRRLGQRSVAWVIGTSLAFEAAVLGLACWLFSRRDF